MPEFMFYEKMVSGALRVLHCEELQGGSRERYFRQ